LWVVNDARATEGHHDIHTHGYSARRRASGLERDLIANYVARADEDPHDLRTQRWRRAKSDGGGIALCERKTD